MGPIIDSKQRDTFTASSQQPSTRALPRSRRHLPGTVLRPTVLTDVPLHAPAYVEEIFGPIAPVVPFSSLDEAAGLADGTEYG